MANMTSAERVFTALGQKEPDRVPLCMMFATYGAKELKLPMKEYYSNADNVIEAQLRLQKKFRTDCVTGFYYSSLEMEAFGGDTIYVEDGPPNSAYPIISDFNDILNLEVPQIEDCDCLLRGLKAISGLKAELGDSVPIMGVSLSPFSLPIMQLGFEKYLYLMTYHKDLFHKLMAVNEQFCVAWSNAQLKAGATAVAYIDPLSSTTNVPPAVYRETGKQIAKRTIAKIEGPTGTHFASGRCLPIIDDIADTGTLIVGISSLEDIGEAKKACKGRMSVLGNLNGLEMCRWTVEETQAHVKSIIEKAGEGGGLLLSENHGEVPYYASEKTLYAIADAIDKYGVYPLKK